MSKDRRSLIGWYGPIALFVAVVLAILVADVTVGTGKATDELALPTPAGTSTPGPSPTLGPTRTPLPTATATVPPPGGDKRDAQRKADVQSLVGALGRYRSEHNEYPSTGGNLQTLCVYKAYDQGCKLEEVLPSLPKDPLNDPHKYGYWYASDGTGYVLIYGLEQPPAGEKSNCTAIPAEGKFDFYVCVLVKE